MNPKLTTDEIYAFLKKQTPESSGIKRYWAIELDQACSLTQIVPRDTGVRTLELTLVPYHEIRYSEVDWKLFKWRRVRIVPQVYGSALLYTVKRRWFRYRMTLPALSNSDAYAWLSRQSLSAYTHHQTRQSRLASRR